MPSWSWERDDFDKNGKLLLLYRQQRFIDEGFIGQRVLDIGGWGKLAFRLTQEGKDVVLLDIDRNLLQKIKKRFRGVKLILAAGESLPFHAQTFDTVHCSETLEHVRSAEQVCAEANRVLSLEGIFCGTIPIPDVVHKRSEARIRFFTRSELQNLLSNFKTIKIEDTPSINPSDAVCSTMFICRKNSAIGDDNINWDQEATRASADEPFSETDAFDYFIGLIPLNALVLDLGCNVGKWYPAFKKLGVAYEGLDFSSVAIEIARKKYPDVTFYLMKAQDMNFQNRFDVVFTNTVLQHMNLETKKVVIPKVYEALKHGGYLIIQEKSDVETPTTFAREGWINFITRFGFKFIKATNPEDPRNGYVFQK